MLRRWIIRSLFICLWGVCAGIWVGSYFQSITVVRLGGGHERAMTICNGLVDIMDADNPVFTDTWWQFDRFPINPFHPDAFAQIRVSMWYRMVRAPSLGFALRFNSAERQVFFPLWFATLLCTLLLWLVWRKTRSKPTGRAFPIEPAPKAHAK